MKRKIVWLALPLVLFALMFGVKWRADHPTATEEDLKIRALLTHSSKIEVSHVIWGNRKLDEFKIKLSEKEFQPFVNCLYLSPKTYNSNSSAVGKKGVVTIDRDDRVATIIATLNLDGRIGELLISRPGKATTKNLHRVTVKRWIELLLSNPRFGPKLQARMKS